MQSGSQPHTTKSEAELLAAYLALREDNCPSCNYNLHHLTSDTCPECGEKLKLRVSLQMPKLAAFITGLIALSISAGFPVLLLGIFILTMLTNNYSLDNPFYLFGLHLLLTAFSTVLLLAWCYFNARLIRSHSRIRWPLAILFWLLCPLTMVLSYAIIQTYQ